MPLEGGVLGDGQTPGAGSPAGCSGADGRKRGTPPTPGRRLPPAWGTPAGTPGHDPVQGSEEVYRRRVIAQEDCPQAVDQPDIGAGQEEATAHQGTHLAGQWSVRTPGGETVTVCAQQVGQEPGVTRVGVRATLAIPPQATVGHAGRHHVDLGVPPLPEEVHQQVVGRFQGDEAVGGGDAQSLADSVQGAGSYFPTGIGPMGS